jgi:hypothetical protein
MKILEFVQAVHYNDKLNPKLWSGMILRQEVRNKLLAIAQDFVKFIALPNIRLKDITISGSNASYGYGEHSDIDLHLVVVMSDDPTLRALFDAKKNNYNFNHKIKLNGIDVEVYVQDSEQTHHSLGIYSVLDNRWLSKPKHQLPKVNDKEVRSKARNYSSMINKALKSDDLNTVTDVLADLKRLRQAGLDVGGEFSVENLAYKLLRARGNIDRLYKHQQKLKNLKLSLENRNED